MNLKNINTSIISCILMILAYLVGAVEYLYLGYLSFFSFQFFLKTIAVITFIMYQLNPKYETKKYMFVGLGALILLNLYFLYFDIKFGISIYGILYLIYITFLLCIIKVVLNITKSTIIVGTISFCLYVLVQLLFIRIDTIPVLLEAFGIFIIWWNEGGYIASKQSVMNESTEDISYIEEAFIILNENYQEAKISNEEFNQRKKELLNLLWENNISNGQNNSAISFEKYISLIKSWLYKYINLSSNLNKKIVIIGILAIVIISGLIFKNNLERNNVQKQIDFVENILLCETPDKIKEQYPEAVEVEDDNDLTIEGYFSGIKGVYRVWCYSDEAYQVVFKWDEETESIDSDVIVDNITKYIGEYENYNYTYDYYKWETESLMFKIYIDDGIWFYLN